MVKPNKALHPTAQLLRSRPAAELWRSWRFVAWNLDADYVSRG
jgi:hypothetical protein